MYKKIMMVALAFSVGTIFSFSKVLAQSNNNIEKPAQVQLSRNEYSQNLQGFWLGLSIANWTGLLTESDRLDYPFYTDADWTENGVPLVKDLYGQDSDILSYVFVHEEEAWGSDDDSDFEYLYQHLMYEHETSLLTPEQIRAGWLKHIYSNEDAPIPNGSTRPQNFLWVSNEKAYYLMKDQALVPPETSDPENNELYMRIDAQLTTEIFGLFAPARPDVALKLAHLPIRVTAYGEAEWISEFYVIMHSLASVVDKSLSMKEQTRWLAEMARKRLPENSYSAKMYDFVKSAYDANSDKDNWEHTRDAVYTRYQIGDGDGYQFESAYDGGINFAASLVSLFYGEGDLLKTIRVGSLAGWDSDNPTATWGGLLGFMLGKEGIESAFGQPSLSEAYRITRTRRNFPDRTPNQIGEDTFPLMGDRGIQVIDRVVTEQMGGMLDASGDNWLIPAYSLDQISPP
jgi:hypothetical protein|tara:strand:+ start:240 stop:1610 length:1371 start_codon:yes stop_codon:yes gene_type:complete